MGRAGEAPAAMVSPRHGPTDTSLCVAKAPQGRFYGWVPGPRNPGPRPPPPQGTQESVPWPILTGAPGVQAPSPFLPKVPGVQAPAPSSLSPASSQTCLPGEGTDSLASWVLGHRKPHLFWSLAPWTRRLPTHLSDSGIQDQAEARQGMRKLRLYGVLFPLFHTFLWPLTIYNDDNYGP